MVESERDMHDYEAIQQKRNKLSGLKMGWYNLVLFVDHILELKKGCLQDVQQVIYKFRMALWWLALFFFKARSPGFESAILIGSLYVEFSMCVSFLFSLCILPLLPRQLEYAPFPTLLWTG